MCDLQSTIEFAVELFKFYNVDLFQRGIYQIRCALRVASKLKIDIEVEAPQFNMGLGTAVLIGSYGASHPFQILYRNEEISLKEMILFRCHTLLNGHNIKETLERIEFSLIVELWFSDNSNLPLTMVSTRTLQLNMSPVHGLHYHLPVLFDYFHLSAVSITIHAALIALHPPCIKKGFLRYIQSCAPKPSKSWNKTNFNLADNVFQNDRLNWRSHESAKVQMQAYEVLKEAYCHLKSVINEYKFLLVDTVQSENITFDYDHIVREGLKKSGKKDYLQSCANCLSELCKENLKLWDYFLINLSHKTLIQQHLSKKHHILRMERFSELFFLNRNPRYSAMECNDQKYIVIADLLRRSKYLATLPPLPVHCSILDGEPATIPIIFEDQYQNKYEYESKLVRKNDRLTKVKTLPYMSSNECCCYKSNHLNCRTKFSKPEVDVFRPFDEISGYITTTKHSKSLDHLHFFSTINFERSFTTLSKDFDYNQAKNDFNAEKAESMQNICSNSAYFKSISNKTGLDEKLERKRKHVKQTDLNEGRKLLYTQVKSADNNRQVKKRKRKDMESNFKPFIIKNLENVKQHCQKLVKSISHNASPESTQNIFKSSSMQFNSLQSSFCVNNEPKYLTNANMNETKMRSNALEIKNKFLVEEEMNSICNSSNNVSFYKEQTELNGLNYRSPLEFNRSQSVPCLIQQKTATMFHCESLPDLTSKTEHCAHYNEVKYYSDSSTSERSGWVSSPSNSENSSALTNSSRFSEEIESVLKFTLNDEFNVDDNKDDCLDSKNSINKKLILGDLLGNNLNKEEQLVPLPPPKEFRDIESPVVKTVSVNNEITDVANILCNLTGENKKIKNTHSYYESKRYVTFEKAKQEFRAHLNFPGILYSDMNTWKSTIPYFHISDEFRMFSPQGMHLVICVHGLDGNSADLRLVKTYLELGLPGAYLDFLMSERNQGDTFSDFDTMTDRLISEILHYLETCAIRPTRISFVGHSLGNIIIRSALTRPEMKFLLPRLHTFLSLSGPHLGTLYNNSGLVNMGMWFMQKWKKSGSLLQLCLKDAADCRKSFLYRLSQRGTLHYFKNILLCGSGQDRYVPLHSARIELCKEAIKDTSELGAVYREMVHNILCPILADNGINFVRYDIHHALPNTANTLIGRAAHIAVLDSELFIEKFMAIAGIKYFR